ARSSPTTQWGTGSTPTGESSSTRTGAREARTMTQRPFVVNVATLRRQPGASRRERREGPIPDLAVTGSSVPVGSPVVVDVLLESVHGGILATGSVAAPWSGECRRCLAA